MLAVCASRIVLWLTGVVCLQLQHLCYLSSEHLSVCLHQHDHRPSTHPVARMMPSARLSSGASPAKALTMGPAASAGANAGTLLAIGEKLDHALTAISALGCRSTQVCAALIQ